MEKISLDPHIEKYYSEGSEKDRLVTHKLERARTLQILKKRLPPAPAVILDVGGASGVYAFELAERGYEVHLIDPIAVHIEQAQEIAKNTACPLASYSIGDARQLPAENASADVVLLFGPLYHLIEPADRLKALQEARRVLKPHGHLFAVGISRFASFMDAVHKAVINEKFSVIQNDFASGVHRKISEDFIFAFLHHPSELKQEVEKAGFKNVSLLAIEGPVWEKQILATLEHDEQSWQKLLTLLESIEAEETIMGASAHIMAVARK
jgi:ubiquinone/menaquinone biosynthesis C-methylase UbiE